MSCKHLVKRKNSSVYHYRIIAPTDLKSVLIQQSLEISFSTGIHRIAQSRATKLNQFVQNLFQAYREGHMASLTMTIVKEFAKQELAKMYRHAEFTYTNTNVFDPSAVSNAIESVNNQEMRFEKNLKTKAREQRDAFDKQDLKRIFYLRKLKSESLDKNKPAYYWVPLLGLYTGARLNELCQLYVNDIKEIDKIWCIDIKRNTNDKKLKNASSERVIPIHPKLIELGFLNFVKEQKKNNSQRLFSHLKLGSDGYIKNVSRFFNVKWLPEIGVKTSKKSFHSLRHTFANELKQAGVNEQVASELLGHASQSITYGRYGKESRIEILLKEISKIRLKIKR